MRGRERREGVTEASRGMGGSDRDINEDEGNGVRFRNMRMSGRAVKKDEDEWQRRPE